MGSVELGANLFRITQAEDKLRQKTVSVNFDTLVSTSFKKYRTKKIFRDRSVNGIIQEYTTNNVLNPRALEYIAYLYENEINVDELGAFIAHYLTAFPEALSKEFADSQIRTNLRRLIRIYDFLKYHN